MATEKRLIDANALIVPKPEATGDPFMDGFCQGKIDSIIEVRALAPTVDAVEVVRCKDCRCDGECSIQDAMNWTPRPDIGNQFCSYGERRTDG